MTSKRGPSVGSKMKASLSRQQSVESVKQPREVKLKPNIAADGSSREKYDSCVFLAHCPTHDQVLLSSFQEGNDAPGLTFLPFMALQPNQAWKDNAQAGFCLLLAHSDPAKFDALKKSRPYEFFRCLQVLRLQLPGASKFVTRAIFYFKIKSSSSFTCCQPIGSQLKWFPLKDIIEGKVKMASGERAAFWGPELVEHCKLITGKQPICKTKILECSLEDAIQLAPREAPRNAEDELLHGLHLTSADVERMYEDYVDFCYPSYYLTMASFAYYLRKHGFECGNRSSEQLFNAFNLTGNGRLSFKELILGMALYDKSAPNGPLRYNFIFRFYTDHNQSGRLSSEQVKALLADMGQSYREDNNLKTLMEGLDLQAFISAIEAGKIPADINSLCRSAKDTFPSITRSIAIKNMMPNMKTSHGGKNLGNVIIKRHHDICLTCLENKYELASHAVTIKANGEMVSRVLSEVQADVATTATNKDNLILTAQQFSTEFVFNNTSVGNVLLKLIREFSRFKGTVFEPRGLLQTRPEELWKLLLTLYREMDILLESENKCQKVYSPCYIIGDIHGNLEDLLSLEATAWSTVPILGASYLFLGDYVDRGKWSLECALYLMAFKVLCPNKVTLLRGNHEVRQLQINYSYKKELLRKYGDTYGIRIWELTNRLFDKMPICALLDDAIYCAHGGIPRSATTIEQINSLLPREINDPQNDAVIAWEILWSDPANRDDFVDTCAARSVDPETSYGFVFNTKRGTAFKFAEQAASTFLKTNKLTHIIRAHEVAPYGYSFHFGSKCVTIFSSSHYCGNDNDCGIILADNQRLQVLHIDTANNSSATN